MPWIQWIVGILLVAAAIAVFYGGILYYGFERLSRPSPSRFSTWVWMGLGVILGIAACAIMLATGILR